MDYGNRYAKMLMDNARIWNSARTKEELDNNMCSLDYTSEPSLIAYYDFNDYRSLELIDKKSGLNGTLNNMTYASWYNGDPCAINSIDKVETIESNIYPNPVSGLLHIQLSKTSEYKLFTYNNLGVKLIEDSFNGNYTTVELNGLQSGIYYVLISDNPMIITLKIIVQ